MHRTVISLAALASILGCLGDRERTAVAAGDTAKTVAMAPEDTSVSPAEEPAPSPSATRPASRTRLSNPRHPSGTKRPTSSEHPRNRVVLKDSVRVPSATGYAPSRDTVQEPSADTFARAPKDTTPAPTRDSVGAASAAAVSPPSPDSVQGHDTVSAAPAPAPVPTPGAEQNARTLPAGTEIRAVLSDSLTSLRDSVGQVLLAHVSGDVLSPTGITVVPAGSDVQLTITGLKPAGSRSASDGTLSLRVDAITIDGRPAPVSATVQPVPHELRGHGLTAGEAEKVGVGAAAGAVLGRVVTGKTKGAVIGGAVGAAGGAVVAAQTGSRDVVVARGTTVVFTLAAPLVAAIP